MILYTYWISKCFKHTVLALIKRLPLIFLAFLLPSSPIMQPAIPSACLLTLYYVVICQLELSCLLSLKSSPAYCLLKQVEKWNEQRENGTFPGPLWIYCLRPAPGLVNTLASRTVPFWISAFRIVNAFVLALQPVSTKLLVMLSLCRSNNWLQWPHMLPCAVWTSFYSRINLWIGTCILSCLRLYRTVLRLLCLQYAGIVVMAGNQGRTMITYCLWMWVYGVPFPG